MVNRPSRLDHSKYLQQQFTNALKKQQDLINDQVTTIKYKEFILSSLGIKDLNSILQV